VDSSRVADSIRAPGPIQVAVPTLVADSNWEAVAGRVSGAGLVRRPAGDTDSVVGSGFAGHPGSESGQDSAWTTDLRRSAELERPGAGRRPHMCPRHRRAVARRNWGIGRRHRRGSSRDYPKGPCIDNSIWQYGAVGMAYMAKGIVSLPRTTRSSARQGCRSARPQNAHRK
jgi:hypothetical protein